MFTDRLSILVFSALILVTVSSCSTLSDAGPQKRAIEKNVAAYTLIPVKSRADLPGQGRSYGRSQTPTPVKGKSYSDKVRVRDALDFIITDLGEASPFSTKGGPFKVGPIEVPQDGRVSVPYVGELQVMDKSLAEISGTLNEMLKPISNTAQGGVTRSNRIARTANVIGEVNKPGPVPLERDEITSLDILAASGGPSDAEHLFSYTLRRNNRDYQFDYQGFRKHPFAIEEGDLLSVTRDATNRFYVMGAINKPTTVPFPVPAPTLADALGAATGLDERRSDASGVFVFRKGSPDEVYTFDLKDPNAVFLTQRFAIRGEDMVYVTEAPLARWNRIVSQLLPASQTAYNFQRTTR